MKAFFTHDYVKIDHFFHIMKSLMVVKQSTDQVMNNKNTLNKGYVRTQRSRMENDNVVSIL